MTKRMISVLLGIGCISGLVEAVEYSATRPNIILMMTDDLGWGDVHCFNPETPIKTPQLDAMAAGMQFNRFYSSSPECSPTRGSVLPGRHHKHAARRGASVDVRIGMKQPAAIDASGKRVSARIPKGIEAYCFLIIDANNFQTYSDVRLAK